MGVPAGFRAFVKGLDTPGGPRVAVVSFGSPYLLSAFPDAGTYLVAWGGREVSQRAAARAVDGGGASLRTPADLDSAAAPRGGGTGPGADGAAGGAGRGR